ncbi:hypothetical protein BDR22DRAFT_891081 [Usnea florida]
MEIARKDNGDQLIRLKFQGSPLAPAASMLCLILATCACETVPAFLFVRPYLSQRRWNAAGEMEVFHAKGLPDWPSRIFQQRQESIAEVGCTPVDNRKANFYASAIGHRFSTGDTKFYYLSQSIESLCQQDILSVHLRCDDLWLQLKSSTKEELQRQISIDDRLVLCFCLLKLVVFSYPDIYSECCWEKVQFQCQNLVDSTVSPLLAVLSWEELNPHKDFNLSSTETLSPKERMLTDVDVASSIPHLVSFILNYSVSKHSHLKPKYILEPSLMQDLTQHCDQMVQDTISILHFQEHFYRTIFPQPRANDSLLIHNQPVVPKLFGFFAIIVALILDIVPEDLHSQMFPAGSDWRQPMLGENPSTIEHFAFLILSLYNMDIQDVNIDDITASGDLELRLPLGLEMARYRKAPEASAILGLCVKEMETTGYISSRECCIITTELIKCCNIMSEEAKAEALALKVLGSQRDPQLKFQQDFCHLNVALADTLMGQGEYESAEFLMLDVLKFESLPRPTQTMIRLRLNKARRRLARGEFIASIKADFMQPVLGTVAVLNRDLKVEVLAEISATVSLAPKQKDPVFEELTSLCHETVAIMSASNDIMDDWRISALEQELGRLKCYTSKTTVDPHASAEIVPEKKIDEEEAFSQTSLPLTEARASSDNELTSTSSGSDSRFPNSGIFRIPQKRVTAFHIRTGQSQGQHLVKIAEQVARRMKEEGSTYRSTLAKGVPR